MTVIQVLLVVLLMCLILWLIQTYLPIEPPFKNVIIAVMVIILIVWLLSVSGIGHMIVTPTVK